MSRFAVGPWLRELLASPAPRDVDEQPWTPTEERRGTGTVCTPVPEQLRASDDPILAQWIATPESLSDWRLAMRVMLRFPVVEVMEREHVFDREAAKRALADLRTGKAVDPATVVRLARHRLETECLWFAEYPIACCTSRGSRNEQGDVYAWPASAAGGGHDGRDQARDRRVCAAICAGVDAS